MPSHHSICPLCEATCGLEITTESGSVTSIRGHARDPFSQGYVCPKGYSLKALEEDPERLRGPLIRTGTSWREASWDEAFAEITARLPPILEQHGRDAVAMYLGNPNVHNLAGQLYAPTLARALGSRNLFSASTLDQMPKHVSCGLMFGDAMSIPVPDLNRTDYLLVLGANPLVSNGSLMTAPNVRARFQAIRARGGKIVVVDPRRTRSAREASEHLFIRPGRDAFFLMGLVHTLFAESLTQVVHEQLRRLAESFSLSELSQRCGIPPEMIQRLARELAGAPSAAVYGRLGTCTQEFGTVCSWLVDVLNILTGNLDRPGGAMFPLAATKTGSGRRFALGKGRSRVRGLPQVNGELPAVAMAEEMLTPGTGQVRALLTVAGNPVLSSPNSDRLVQALEGLEFMVSVDCYLNETTRHAHVILPGPSHLQRGHYDVVFSQLAIHNYARYSPPVLPLQPGQMHEWEILLRLAAIVGNLELSTEQMDATLLRQKARGREELLDVVGSRPGPERLLDLLLRMGPYGLTMQQLRDEPLGIDLGPLQPRTNLEVELAPPEILQDAERMRMPWEDEGEFVLIGRRDLRSNNSWMHNLPVLVKGPAVCTLLMQPDDAARLGLKTGDMARVRTAVASLEIVVEETADIMAGVVSIPHGWGHGQAGARQTVAGEHAGVNVNRLLATDRTDPLSGTAIQNAVSVRVERL